MTGRRFAADQLRDFAAGLLEEAGQPPERARAVAEILVEGDLLGQTTHGLQLLPAYLDAIADGGMPTSGEPEVISDRGGVFAWDGKFLPGPWLVVTAIEEAMRRVAEHGCVTATLWRTHHIAALQAYLKRVTDRGLVMLLTTSDPRVANVSPHGGLEGRYSPNPIAFGAPTGGDPILIDVSMSAATVGIVRRRYAEGRHLDHPWLKDAWGNPTADPAVCHVEPKGSVFPLGGPDLGHKGFALGLIVEVLTSGLAGHGRAERPGRWSGNVFLQVFDPAAFGGREGFLRETSYLAESCRESPVPEGAPAVRMPGERALARRAEQLANGVSLYAGIEDALRPWADKLDVPMPAAL